MTDEQLIKRISEMSVSIFGGIDGINLAKLTKNFKEEFVRRIIVKSPSASGQKSLIKTIREKYIEWKRETDITYKMFPSPFGGREYLYPKYMEDLYFRIDCGEIIEAEEFTMISSWDDANSSGEAGRGLLEARIAELEKENEALKQQIEELQSQPQTSEVQQASTNEALVELFSHVMYGDEQNAKAFIESAKGRNDVEITDLVAQWVRENKISSQSCRRDLWRLLHAAKLYNGTESNYNTAMRNKQ